VEVRLNVGRTTTSRVGMRENLHLIWRKSRRTSHSGTRLQTGIKATTKVDIATIVLLAQRLAVRFLPWLARSKSARQ
jgi:hypothetical protein